MRTPIAALGVALLTLSLAVPVVEATPTEVNVRIEGRSETLFEGPVLTDGRNVKAASDAKAPPSGRRCNGLNNNANATPGATPTAAAVDAMSIVGEGFDGQWYAEPFEDYFVKRWGPDAEDIGKGEHWGVAVNNVFTNVGGCQYRLDDGDEVLWAYDAFSGRPRLGLYPADYVAGAKPLTATAELGEPFVVDVVAWSGAGEGTPPASPQRSGSDPYEGALVAPVATDAKGFQKVEVESPDALTTNAEGEASISFDEPGWHRIKAVALDSAGEETAIRSNRLDICVPEPPAADCGVPPADDLMRESGWVPLDEETETPDPVEPSPVLAVPNPVPSESRPSKAHRVLVTLQRLDRSRIAQGLVRVSWRVLDPGAGIERWTVASQALGRRRAPYVNRARGTSATWALLRLPRPASYRLRLTIVDTLGRSSSLALGRVQVPA